MDKFKKISKILGLIVFALFFYFAGYLVGHKNLVFEANYQPKIANREMVKPRSVDFAIFWQAWDKVMEKYVGATNAQEMVYGATAGMIKALNDPYSMLLKPNETKTFFEDLAGEIQGIGAEISAKDDKIIVVSPLDGSPAARAGLKPKDEIVLIDDKSTEGLTLDQAIAKIRGRKGTKVKLGILRDGWTDPKTFEIERDVIKLASVTLEWKADNIAYLKINQFGDDTVELAQKYAEEIKTKGAKSVVVDLRNNPGGYLDGAIKVTEIFIKPNVVVKEKFKDGRIQEDRSEKEPILADQKLVVLVNEGSASASEIFAGAVQDYKRAVLVGEKTFGKGSVQDLENLSGGAILRITTAKWLTPKDRAIDGVGIEPDNKVGLTDDDYKNNRDPQLDKALELVK